LQEVTREVVRGKVESKAGGKGVVAPTEEMESTENGINSSSGTETWWLV